MGVVIVNPPFIFVGLQTKGYKAKDLLSLLLS